MAFGSVFNLSSLNGSNGFIINAAEDAEYLGHSVSSAGDINGDGTDDLIIGVSHRYPFSQELSQTYVVFGSTSSFASSFNLSNLNGSNGFAVNTTVGNDFFGESVSAAGDINGDGTDDLIIGALGADPNGLNSGKSYVVFGSTTSFASRLNVSSLNGSNGFVLNGIQAYDTSGKSVSAAGDINGDGTDDLIIGAPYAEPNGSNSGQSYVVFGSTTGFGSRFNLSNLNGSNGFILNGISANDISGRSVSNAGDINNDGIDDLIIGAWLADPSGVNVGQSYVVFGSTAGFASNFNLSNLNGSNGFAINGNNEFSASGWSVSNAGDINNDGADDLIIGAITKSYVVFGSTAGFASSFNLSNLNGSHGFAINGIDLENQAGYSVSNAGDVNNDGIDDLIIGARYGDPNGLNSGQSYIIFGQTTSFASSFNLSNLNGSKGFTINGINSFDNSGTSVSSAGDINGDKIDDVIIGAPNAHINGDKFGQSYVVFGQASTIEGDNNNNLLNGTSGNDIIIGLGGNDNLNGLAGNDNLDGGSGDDSLNGGSGNDTLNGGIGSDIYTVDNIADLVVETNTIANEIDLVRSVNNYTLANNVENLTLIGSANINGVGNDLNNLLTGNIGNNFLDGNLGNDSLNGLAGNDSLNGQEGNDNLNGGAGNDSLNGGAGNDTLNGVTGDDSYIVDSSFDVIRETNTIITEIDTVQSTINYTLGVNLENLTLAGTSNINGVGNNLNNLIIGNTGVNILDSGIGNDILQGGAGNDTLNGGFGVDSFNFSSGLAFNTNKLGIDVINDFTVASDKIVLSKTTFTAISSNVGTGFSNTSDFAIVTTLAQAQTSTAVIVYNSVSDRIFYNQNSTAAGFGTGAAFAALLGNPNLSGSDFSIIV